MIWEVLENSFKNQLVLVNLGEKNLVSTKIFLCQISWTSYPLLCDVKINFRILHNKSQTIYLIKIYPLNIRWFFS